MTDEKLPVGRYTLPDGREVVGLDEFEVRRMARESWRLQGIADVRLALKLEAMPRPAAVHVNTAVRLGVTQDLFALDAGFTGRSDERGRLKPSE
jgi:hypothetical protein